MLFEIVKGADGRFFWRIVDGRGVMVTFSSARYRTSEACRVAIEDVCHRAADAGIIDLTIEPDPQTPRVREASQTTPSAAARQPKSSPAGRQGGDLHHRHAGAGHLRASPAP